MGRQTDINNQVDIETYIKQSEKNERIASRVGLPDRVVIEEDDPRRLEAIRWPADFDWHMAVHECRELLEMRKRLQLERPEGLMCPVVYCWCYCDPGQESWMLAGKYDHASLSACPYCDAKLPEGKGQIILERRFAGKPYEAVFERDWPKQEATL